MRKSTSTIAVVVTMVGVSLAGPRVIAAWQQGSLQAPSTAGTAPAGLTRPTPSAVAAPRALLDRYCITCHSDRLKTGGLTLERLDVEHVGPAASVWEKVVQKLRSGAMPPPGRPRPDAASYESVARDVEAALDRAASLRPNPGRPAIHRLNRTEYTNAIRDLLALDVDGAALLPADDMSYGFDNSADVLTISQPLLERYLAAARQISRLAIGDPTLRPVKTYKVPALMRQTDRMSEDLPFGSRGGLAVRHYFPRDGEYVVKIRLQRAATGAIFGLADENMIDLHVDGVRVRRFTVGGSRGGSPMGETRSEPDAGLDVQLLVKAGLRPVGVSFEERAAAVEGIVPEWLPVENFAGGVEGGPPMSVNTVEISGPYDGQGVGTTPSRQRIFVCRPRREQDEAPCAAQILATLARRAYRRPATRDDVQALLGFYDAARRTGTFDEGVQAAIERLLIDLEFLFRLERDPVGGSPGSAYRLTDLELASRLSFFLWSSIPDEALLRAAELGTLRNPGVLDHHVRRMLLDRRASALVTGFAAQWLHLRNLESVRPDRQTFPEFDDNLRDAFERETALFFDSQVRADRSVMELLTANYTFLNERLARHYGIPRIAGSHFRRVTLPDDRRAGLLGQGSVLTVTSYAHRTSPTIRGKWLLENLLGAPPPPPPPNVPALNDEAKEMRAASVRERMEQHRSNPVCASCHASMDPLGFALENFDGIGRWRTQSEAGTPIDSTGVLPDGTKFDGPVELRSVLASRHTEFVTTVVTKLLIYAVGRGVEYYDAPTIRTIVREAAAHDYHWSSVILGIVTSTPFQMRRTES